MNPKRVRHVILTVSRTWDPSSAYDTIMEEKTIPRLIGAVAPGEPWLWVLEFHLDGYPHWHVIVEHDGMIGHRRIADRWSWGLCWESWIRNSRHWGGIVGYFGKGGYFGGDG